VTAPRPLGREAGSGARVTPEDLDSRDESVLGELVGKGLLDSQFSASVWHVCGDTSESRSPVVCVGDAVNIPPRSMLIISGRCSRATRHELDVGVSPNESLTERSNPFDVD
jgi:hypothetical protein